VSPGCLGVEKRDYHHLSRFEIGGAKRIYQQLSVPGHLRLLNELPITDLTSPLS